ncbi:MAG: DUF433 domain-containing protein [Ignavibacteriae bacterium]|nr:DUF433 domain-containing protein [Ignavibacteriota bacterium]
MDNVTVNNHIETTPGICGGKPRIAGHRITVENIVIWHDRLRMTADEIADDYNISLSDIYAAMAYYYDHKPEIDASMARGEALLREMKRTNPSKLAQIVHELED